MPTTHGRRIPALHDIFGGPRGVLRNVSTVYAEGRVRDSGGSLSDTTIRHIRAGQVGRIESVRSLAVAFTTELRAEWHREIAAQFRSTSAEAVVAWVVWMTETDGGRLPGAAPPVGGGTADPRLRDLVRSVALELAADEPGRWFCRCARERAERIAAAGGIPPPLPAGWWAVATMTEAEALAREYERACAEVE